MIDAYMHAGGLRFGAASLTLRECTRYGLDKAVIVLPPSCPDFKALELARSEAGERIRLIGIPFGASESKRAECTQWQLDAGVTGLRLMPEEVRANAASLDLVGASGRWLFAINVYDHHDLCELLMAWLGRYPQGHIALPHCLKAGAFADTVPNVAAFRRLLAHPRVCAVISRQGNTGTRLTYPFADLLPWLNDLVAALSWSRICWGSEYPVLYWRDETMPDAQAWLRRLFPDLSAADWQAVHHDNAQRFFFSEAAPTPQASMVPSWIPDPPHDGLSNIVAQKGLKFPPHVCSLLHKAYLDEINPQQPELFSAWLARWIAARVER
jgi:predicted TIM-barrel fold metal-dependent hydrolase